MHVAVEPNASIKAHHRGHLTVRSHHVRRAQQHLPHVLFRIALAACLPVLLVACKPGVTYRQVEMAHVVAGTADPSNPPEREIAFSLQTSSVIVTATDRQRDDERAGNRCEPRSCLDEATWTVAADRDNNHIYLAKLSRGTKITLTPTDGDPLLPKSLTQTFTDPAAVAIAKVAGLAVAGMTAGGPWVAIVASLGGYSILDRTKADPMAGIACLGQTYVLPLKPSVRLPLVLHHVLPDAAWPLDPSKPVSDCWHPLAAGTDRDNGGWFYRVTDQKRSGRNFPPTLDDSDWRNLFVRSETLDGVGQVGFWPATACRRVLLEVVWWQGLVNGSTAAIVRREVTVSDPDWVQHLDLTKDGRSITLRAACGGIATSSAAVDQTGVVESILKGYNDYKAAEAKRN